MAIRAELRAGMLGACVFALEALLATPDLHLDCLEQATQDVIEVARETLLLRTCASRSGTAYTEGYNHQQ